MILSKKRNNKGADQSSRIFANLKTGLLVSGPYYVKLVYIWCQYAHNEPGYDRV